MLSSLSKAKGQIPNGDHSANQSSLELDFANLEDTIPPKYYYKEDPTLFFDYDPRKGTSNYNHQYDLSRKRSLDYIHLGNQGSSAFPITKDIRSDIGFDFGFHQYDIYKKVTPTLKYFDVKSALSDMYFSPKGQGNFLVKALYANRFSNKVDFTLDYRRINQSGIYQHSKTKTTSLHTGLRYSKKKSYEFIFELLLNNHNEEHNGGVSDTTVFNEPFNDNRINIPVYFSDASSRHEHFSYDLYNIFKLGGDSTTISSRLVFKNSFNHGYYRYYDADLSESDINYYSDFVQDDRGLRLRIAFRHYQNGVSLRTNLKKTVDLKVGIRSDIYRLKNDINSFSANNLHIYGSTNIYLSKYITLSGKLDFGLGDIAGNVGLHSKIEFPINNIFKLEGGFNFFRTNPTHLSEQLVVTNRQIWQNDFAKPIESEIWASVSIPKTKTIVTFSQAVTDNAIYLNDQIKYIQSVDIFSSTKLTIAQGFTLGPLNLDQTALIQTFNKNIYNLPSLFIKQSLFFKFKLFKGNLGNEMGIEHRYLPNSTLRRYTPVIGQLFDSGEMNAAHSSLDIFALFKIESFNFLLRADNFLNLFSNEVYYPIYRYPAYDFQLRIAIRWLIRG